MAVLRFECIAPVEAVLGEGPLWDQETRTLWWVDIKGEAIFSMKPEDLTSLQRYSAPHNVSALVKSDTHKFLAVCRIGFVGLDIVGDKVCITPIANPEAHLPGNRFNDGKLAPDGRFVAGTMDDNETERQGAFWSLSAGQASMLDDGYMICNGPAFSLDGRKIFLVDSADRTVFVAEYEAGAISKKSVYRAFCEEEGYPDGLAIDHRGDVWIAFWDGHCIRQFSNTGDLIAVHPVPVPRPTSVCFGGGMIFVTSARIGLSDEQLRMAPLSGGVFVATVP